MGGVGRSVGAGNAFNINSIADLRQDSLNTAANVQQDMAIDPPAYEQPSLAGIADEIHQLVTDYRRENLNAIKDKLAVFYAVLNQDNLPPQYDGGVILQQPGYDISIVKVADDMAIFTTNMVGKWLREDVDMYEGIKNLTFAIIGKIANNVGGSASMALPISGALHKTIGEMDKGVLGEIEQRYGIQATEGTYSLSDCYNVLQYLEKIAFHASVELRLAKSGSIGYHAINNCRVNNLNPDARTIANVDLNNRNITFCYFSAFNVVDNFFVCVQQIDGFYKQRNTTARMPQEVHAIKNMVFVRLIFSVLDYSMQKVYNGASYGERMASINNALNLLNNLNFDELGSFRAVPFEPIKDKDGFIKPATYVINLIKENLLDKHTRCRPQFKEKIFGNDFINDLNRSCDQAIRDLDAFEGSICID